jgi:multidrug efflux pump subunit AcrA (membrane-fusion protein)
MYAKLLIPWDTIDIVAIPPEAVRRIGQLEMVAVKVDNTWQMRFVKTGKRHDGLLEILSGLSGDEILMVGKQGNDRKQ